jgi:hypothetical protein
MNVTKWAIKYGVSHEALLALDEMCGVDDSTGDTNVGLSESYIQQAVRLDGSKNGGKLMRNNVGALPDKSGRWVRYGLMNDSKKMNEQIKSSDLIGWNKVLITPEHVGMYVAQFKAREVKESGWVYKNTPREQAQKRFINLVNLAGGDAKFVNSVDS